MNIVSQQAARHDPTGRRMLYVLGFGIAGAIVADIFVLAYLASFHVSG